MTLKNFIEKKLPKCTNGVISFKVFEKVGNEVIDSPLFTNKEWDAETFDKKWLKAEVVHYSIGYGICNDFTEVCYIYVYDPDKPVEGRPYYFYMDSCGDGVSTGSGWVKLTPEQARWVAFALDKSNWKDWVPGVPMVDGDTRIHLDKWKTVSQVEKGKKK
jgi:hypothetical protein